MRGGDGRDDGVVVATKKLAIVQSLRGLAASMVVLMHFNVFIAPVMLFLACVIVHAGRAVAPPEGLSAVLRFHADGRGG